MSPIAVPTIEANIANRHVVIIEINEEIPKKIIIKNPRNKTNSSYDFALEISKKQLRMLLDSIIEKSEATAINGPISAIPANSNIDIKQTPI